MTEKPKTIFKDGLRWNLLPKEVYGKEVYVPCNLPHHYLRLGMAITDEIHKKPRNQDM